MPSDRDASDNTEGARATLRARLSGARVDLPCREPDDLLHRHVSRRLERNLPPLGPSGALGPSFARVWDLAQLGFDRAAAFREASEEDRRAIQGLFTRDFLEQSSLAAGAGLAIASKRMIEAETLEERQLWALRAAERSEQHAALGRLFAAPVLVPEEEPMLLPWTIIADSADREAVVWAELSLSRWWRERDTSLARGCRGDALRRLLQHAADRAREHEDSMRLLCAGAAAPRPRRSAVEALDAVLTLVRRDVERPLEVISRVLGDPPGEQRLKLREELTLDQAWTAARRKVASVLDEVGATIHLTPA